MATGDSLVQGNQAQAASMGITIPGVGGGTPATTADVAGNQAAAAKLGVSIPGVNGASSAAPPPPVPQTQSASAISNHLSSDTSTGITFPQSQPQAPITGVSVNNATTIPTAESIIDQGTQTTPAEATNQTLLQKVAALVGSNKGQTDLTNTAEANAGVPAMAATVNTLTSQVEALANQATDLQNQASPGGAIANQEQQDVLGRGVTTAGLAPISAGDLRKNQIQQSAIASQALTLKSALFAAQGNLTLAQDAADKAAKAQYEDQQNQIAYQQALIAANAPQMTKEEKAQADTISAQLADRQNQITQAQDDKKTILAMVAAAYQNNPGNPAAMQAAQQAISLSNQQVPDLTAAFNLLGQYQSNPLDTEQKIAAIQASRAATAKSNYELSAEQGTGSSSVPVQNGNGSTVNVPTNVAPYYNTSHSGVGYVDASSMEGTAAQKTAIINQAQASGLKVITNKNTATDLFNIGDANNKLDTVLSTLQGIDQPDWVSRLAFGLGATKLAVSTQSSSAQAASGALSSIGTDVLKAMQGVQGSRMSQAAVANITKELPTVYDTQATVQTKVQNLQKLLNDRENAILGTTGTNGSNQTTLMMGPDGKQYNVPNDQVAAFTKAGGHT